jgi:eukaryotic-like serine/threonine-protein kinase
MNWDLAPGDMLAHYRVLSPIGAGAMGQVYLAEDARLGRRLALKVLSRRSREGEDRLGRFEREARAVSALNHPNILTIYDVGEADGLSFIATEYIEGLTLRALLDRGRLSTALALDVTVQVGEALAAAHQAGVIHRDLKPENVMIRPDGYVKVLDFGVAKLLGDNWFSPTADAPTRLVETTEGVLLGTFSYMAPEQARGRDIDARADLFSLGVLAYEMLAGRTPFNGASAADVIGALLLLEPASLRDTGDVPEALERVVMRALRKDPDQRYQSCSELLDDLRAIGQAVHESAAGPEPELATAPDAAPRRRRTAASGVTGRASRVPRRRRRIDSLVVLPLVSAAGDGQDLDYFSDGLTESLIDNLSQLPRLRVMARSTVFRYQGQHPDPREVGRDLGVQVVLTGRVTRQGTALVVGVELVDAQDGARLWGSSISRPASDAFALQAVISEEITAALRLRLTPSERRRLAKQHTGSAEAYRLYIRGRYFLNHRTAEALREARALFERAVSEDSNYAMAFAGLADCCSLLAVTHRTSSGPLLIEEARGAASKALTLDETLAEAHASMAFIRFRFDWHWAEAEAEFSRAVQLNPGHAPSRQWYAMFLASRARFDAALAEMRRALELDPLSPVIQAGIGRVLHFAGAYEQALAQYDRVVQLNPAFGQAHIDTALTRMARGELTEARASLVRAEALLGQVSTVLLLRLCCDAREGRMADAREEFARLRRRYDEGEAGPDDLAMGAAALAEWPLARAWLAEACARRAPFLVYLDVEPAMAPLRLDEECRVVLRRHGFDAVA